MKKLPFILLGALALAGNTFGQTTATSDPVGFNTVTALDNSDTRLSMPLHRPTAYQGTVASVAGNVITLAGTPGLTASQFVYASGSQSNTYYVEFGSGNKNGMFYTVVDNTSGTITLNLNGDVIDGTTNQVVAGDTVRIIPFWTLSTLFPGQQGITGTSSIAGAAPVTQILIPDVVNSGIDLVPTATYYYYTGTAFGGAGWRQLGGGLSNKKDDAVLSPDLYVVVRENNVGATSSITTTGSVPVNQRAYVIGTIAANTPQDNAIAVDVPVSLTLAQSNLIGSGAFAGTSSISGAGGDQILVYDDTVALLDKVNSATYYFYTGTAFGGAGWRKLGGGLTTIRDNDIVFTPGSGYIIRKNAAATATSVVWTLPTPY